MTQFSVFSALVWLSLAHLAPRALVVAEACADNSPNERTFGRCVGVQTDHTLELLEKSGLEIPIEGGGILELEKFQDCLVDYTITEYKYGNKGRDVLFEGVGRPKKINLLHHEQHYIVVISLTATFSGSYSCDNCHAPYNLCYLRG
ncbi:hypothetical protein JTB14_006929 [Gonioctena quinquepunctata]|nr:hypothetical protein JTB14_006929 [Gonioctena quinquepunctata]